MDSVFLCLASGLVSGTAAATTILIAGACMGIAVAASATAFAVHVSMSQLDHLLQGVDPGG